MENTKQALSARIEEVKKMVEAIESELKSVNEPKDGEWYYSHNGEGDEWIYKHKDKKDEYNVNYYILIFKDGVLKQNQYCSYLNTARKITPEEALPYFKKYFEKQGFKEGCKFLTAETKEEHVFESVESSTLFDFHYLSYNGITGFLFDNDTNTFATLVEEKVEPLNYNGLKIIADSEGVEFHGSMQAYVLPHSVVADIYKLSLKAQGK